VDIAQAIERYHSACDAFATGDPAPIKALYARTDDVLLANPFGGSSHGWEAVSHALDDASSTFRDGKPVRFEELARHASADLVAVFEREHWETKVRGRDDLSPFDLRVTTTFRREADGWKLVGRHADPLTTRHVDGPLRPTS
jgi:ketosteroid isomerase-like protein